MSNVAFRVDGGTKIGMGHIMRCLSLADQFREIGHKVIFYSNMVQGIDRIRQEGFEVHTLDIKFSAQMSMDSMLDEEVRKLKESIIQSKIDYIIIDSYRVNKEYFLRIKDTVKRLIYIDDVNKFFYPVDILVNYNINAVELDYGEPQSGQVRLLGPDYALLRKQFYNIPPRMTNENIKEIMLTSGGTNPDGTCEKLLGIILNIQELQNCRINLIVGSGFDNVEGLKNAAEQNPNIVLYHNIKNISEVMLRSDIAISAGGSTLYELCACGTPTITYILADNQEGLVNSFCRHDYVVSLGWYNKINENTLKKEILELANSYERRKSLSTRMQKLVDGNGAKRTAEAILNY